MAETFCYLSSSKKCFEILSKFFKQNFDDCIPEIKNAEISCQENLHLLLSKGSEVTFDLLLSDDITLQRLNKDYRGIDKPTNVLSFPNLIINQVSKTEERLSEKEHPAPISKAEFQKISDRTAFDFTSHVVFVGDIACSYERVHSEALIQNKSFKDHLIHLILHGFLHLLGYDHILKKEAAHMEKLEIYMLKFLKIANPYLTSFIGVL